MLGALDLRVGGEHTPRARLFWLPPGQSGSRVADLGDAKWIVRLKSERWVPTVAVASSGGGSAGPAAGSASRRELLAPRDVALRRTQSNRHLPLAALPLSFVKSKLAKLLAFGTAPPPSPMARLVHLAEAAARGGDHAPSGALAAETWRSVALGALTFTPEEVRDAHCGGRRCGAGARCTRAYPSTCQPSSSSPSSLCAARKSARVCQPRRAPPCRGRYCAGEVGALHPCADLGARYCTLRVRLLRRPRSALTRARGRCSATLRLARHRSAAAAAKRACRGWR